MEQAEVRNGGGKRGVWGRVWDRGRRCCFQTHDGWQGGRSIGGLGAGLLRRDRRREWQAGITEPIIVGSARVAEVIEAVQARRNFTWNGSAH